MIHDKHCEEGVDVRLEPYSYEEDAFYVQPDGNMWMPVLDLMVPYDKYCLGHFQLTENETDIVFSALRCDDSIELESPESKVYSQGKFINFRNLISFLIYVSTSWPFLEEIENCTDSISRKVLI